MNIFIKFQIFFCFILLQNYFGITFSKNSVDFEINFGITGLQQRVTMDEEMTRDFISKMKKIVIKTPDINGYHKSTTFESQPTDLLKILEVRKVLEGKQILRDENDDKQKSKQIWVIYVYLAKILKIIVTQLKNAKDKEIKNRIFGMKNNEIEKFYQDLDNFLKRTEEHQLKTPQNKREEEKNDAQKFYDLLHPFHAVSTMKMNGIVIAKSEENNTEHSSSSNSHVEPASISMKFHGGPPRHNGSNRQ